MAIDEGLAENFEQRLWQLRTERDLSLSKLSDLSGIEAVTLWRWENRGNSHAERLQKLAFALGVSLDYLITGREADYWTVDK